jgi:GTPase SAR1 family protein
MFAKILITGMSNTGKTSLLKPLKDVLVISRDGKPFSLELPHVNIPDYTSIDDLLDLVAMKLHAYKDKVGKYPKTIVFDSVSRIFTDIETYCSKRFKGYDVWSNVNADVNKFVSATNQLLEDYNIILIAHAIFDVDAKKFIETCKGSFAKTGGFLSTVDYAINIDIVGNKRIVTHKGMNLARTLIDDIPEKQEVQEFNLQDYLDKVESKSNVVTEKWSI